MNKENVCSFVFKQDVQLVIAEKQALEKHVIMHGNNQVKLKKNKGKGASV